MSGETDGRASPPSNAGSVASVYSARTAASTYATEVLSAQEKHELFELILYRKSTGTLRETRMLARKLDECQRTEAVFILFQLATSAMEEMIDNAVDGGARGSTGASREMELLQEIQRLELKLRDAEENALEMSAHCEEAEALRQEAENAVLKMSARCEEAEKMRSECEHALELGAEKDERIDLLREEIARMQEERMAADTENLAVNLRKEISDLQAKYQQACERASELQSRLESPGHRRLPARARETPRSSPLFAPRPRRTWVSRQTGREAVKSNGRRAVTPASFQYSVILQGRGMFDGKAFLLGEGFSRGGSLFSIIFKLWYKRTPNGETEARTPSATAPNLPGLGIETPRGF